MLPFLGTLPPHPFLFFLFFYSLARITPSCQSLNAVAVQKSEERHTHASVPSRRNIERRDMHASNAPLYAMPGPGVQPHRIKEIGANPDSIQEDALFLYFLHTPPPEEENLNFAGGGGKRERVCSSRGEEEASIQRNRWEGRAKETS